MGSCGLKGARGSCSCEMLYQLCHLSSPPHTPSDLGCKRAAPHPGASRLGTQTPRRHPSRPAPTLVADPGQAPPARWPMLGRCHRPIAAPPRWSEPCRSTDHGPTSTSAAGRAGGSSPSRAPSFEPSILSSLASSRPTFLYPFPRYPHSLHRMLVYAAHFIKR